MKYFLEILVFVGIFNVIWCGSFSIINSSMIDCDENDECEEVCEFEGVKVLPGSGSTDNGKCLAIFCSEDHTVTVHTCEKEDHPDCTWTHSYSKPYPDCCNTICQSITQLSEDSEENKLTIFK